MKVGDTMNDAARDHGKPLDGVRVLAVEQMQSLPYATQMLARLGADVVKVESPKGGDSGRGSLPAVDDPHGRPIGATFLRNNFGKRSISVDLKDPRGRDLVLELAPRFDVFCQNFRAGVIDRLGLGYDHIVAVHPRVVYCSISGFGTTLPTPYGDRPAYAPIVEAMAGLYDFRRYPDRAPLASPLGALGDTGSALFATIGILAALRHRDLTSMGEHVDIAMLDSMVALGDAGINYLSLGITSGGDTPGINDAFAASDGYFVMQCGRPHMFEALANLIGTPEWLTDPDLATGVHWRARLEDRIRPAVEAWAAHRTRAEACEALGDAGIAAGPVQTAAEVIADEHTAAHGMVVEFERPAGDGPPVLAVGNPVKLSNTTEGPETRMPWLGEHTDSVLHTELGFDDDTLAALRADSVIA
ncbi:MAG: CoA transferase [Acidimicrobiia bacterium]